MKQPIITLTSLALLMHSTLHASDEFERHTISIGYAKTGHHMDKPRDLYGIPGYNNAADGLDNLGGVNFKYRYEINADFGVIASWTHTYIGQTMTTYGITHLTNIGDITFNSFMAGPTFRLNQWASAYLTVGNAYADYSAMVVDHDYPLSINNGWRSRRESALTYSIGGQFNPVKNLAIDLAWEHADMDGFNEVNTWVIGVGWHF